MAGRRVSPTHHRALRRDAPTKISYICESAGDVRKEFKLTLVSPRALAMQASRRQQSPY